MSPYRMAPTPEDDKAPTPRRWPLVLACAVVSTVGVALAAACFESWGGGPIAAGVAIATALLVRGIVRKNSARVKAKYFARVDEQAELAIRAFGLAPERFRRECRRINPLRPN